MDGKSFKHTDLLLFYSLKFSGLRYSNECGSSVKEILFRLLNFGLENAFLDCSIVILNQFSQGQNSFNVEKIFIDF